MFLCRRDDQRKRFEDMDRLKIFNEIAATVILILCVAGAIIAFLIYGHTTNRETVQHEYVYTIRVDSTGVVTKESLAQIDSVKASIKEHEHAIEDRYEYLLEQRENAENFLTIGGIFVTIVLSVFGFFGYKSFKSIEEEAKERAKKIAEDTTEKIAEEKATNVATKLNTKLNNELKKEQKETLRSFKKEDIPDMVTKAVEQKFGTVVGGKMSVVEDVIGRLSEIEKDITQLKKAKDEEAQVKNPTQKRRPRLEEVPGIQPAELNDLAKNGESETANTEG